MENITNLWQFQAAIGVRTIEILTNGFFASGGRKGCLLDRIKRKWVVTPQDFGDFFVEKWT